MASNPFQKAVKSQAKLRLALDGPSGSGKTYTALVAATALANGGKVAVIDTERGSASLYADKFEFDVVTLDNFNPKYYVDLINVAEEAGYAVIVIDSLSHAWEGEGGALDMVDDAAARSQSKNSYFAWRDVTPLHRQLVDAMLQSKCHVIATMRSKTEYVVETDSKGRSIPRKVGMAPIQRQGMEYEFTIVGDMDLDHNLVISKSRMDAIADAVEKKPNEKFFKKILDWLNSGVVAEAPKPAFKPATQPASVSKMAPASIPIYTNGNGHKATAPAPELPIETPAAAAAKRGNTEGLLDQLGEKLWPGLWAEKKPILVNASNGDIDKSFENADKRRAALSDNSSLKKHIAASWPGYETLIDKMVAHGQEWRDPLSVVRGIAKAAVANANQSGQLDDGQLLLLVTTEIDIPEGF